MAALCGSSCRSWNWPVFAMFLSLNIVRIESFMDMEELKSVYYGLDILSEPVVISKGAPFGAVQVTSKYGQQYQCTFPDHTVEEKRKEEEEKIAIEAGIVEMLKPIGLKDCLFKSKDWWSYEFCYGKFIRQFHMEDGEIKGNIIYLGYYLDDFNWGNETARNERLRSKATVNRYHSQTYTQGTKCDLTGQPRRAEVRFMCEENSEDYLARVDEAETCVYTVTVMTSRICRHPYLKAPARRKPVAITCNPLLTELQFQDYKEEKAEQKRKQELMQAAAKQRYGQKATTSPSDLDKALELEMSRVAKELLTQPIEKLFPEQQHTPMTKDDFVGTFGNDEDLWELYLKGIEINLKRHQEVQKRLGDVQQRMKEKRAELSGRGKEEGGKEGDRKTAENEEVQGAEKQEGPDEDDDLLAEFDAEISAIKARFRQSQEKLLATEQKLGLQKNWESQLESVIKEAESELGVKVDRTLISGLSNTLDKLANKLHDTQAQLSNMDSELEKLYEKGEKKDGKEEKEEETSADKKEESGSLQDTQEGLKDPTETDTEMEDSEAQGLPTDMEGKILPPPKTDPSLGSLEGGGQRPGPAPAPQGGRFREDTQAARPEPLTDGEDGLATGAEEEAVVEGADGVGEDAAAPDEPVLKITISSPTQEEGEEEEDLELPNNVQKMLEDSVRKEYERHRTQSDSQSLSFDADHSFHKDKTVHVIQQEDENGKTNRFIFVVGFDTFNDESSEKMKQNQLEENYGFVYRDKKEEKTPGS